MWHMSAYHSTHKKNNTRSRCHPKERSVHTVLLEIITTIIVIIITYYLYSKFLQEKQTDRLTFDNYNIIFYTPHYSAASHTAALNYLRRRDVDYAGARSRDKMVIITYITRSIINTKRTRENLIYKEITLITVQNKSTVDNIATWSIKVKYYVACTKNRRKRL